MIRIMVQVGLRLGLIWLKNVVMYEKYSITVFANLYLSLCNVRNMLPLLTQ